MCSDGGSEEGETRSLARRSCRSRLSAAQLLLSAPSHPLVHTQCTSKKTQTLTPQRLCQVHHINFTFLAPPLRSLERHMRLAGSLEASLALPRVPLPRQRSLTIVLQQTKSVHREPRLLGRSLCSVERRTSTGSAETEERACVLASIEDRQPASLLRSPSRTPRDRCTHREGVDLVLCISCRGERKSKSWSR